MAKQLLNTGNTPPPKAITSKKSDLSFLETDSDKERGAGTILGNTDELYSKATVGDINKSDPNFTSNYGGRLIGGFNYNYEHNGGKSRWGDDLHEKQAENQGQWNKAGSMLTRIGGEFLLNVAETPGIVVGAVGALATGDISKMTDNAWSNAIDSAKDSLHKIAPVYQFKAVKEGNVWAKMSSIDWWAVDGASGIAFMAAALAPGLAVTKGLKGVSIIRALNRGSKLTRGIVNKLDDVARYAGVFSEKAALTAARGEGASALMDIINTTAINTTYESGIEARGAQKGYEKAVKDEYLAGKISFDKYLELKATSPEVAAKVFAANVGVLLVPNLIMSRQILGVKSISNKIMGSTQRNALNRLETKAVTEAPKEAGFFAKTANKLQGSKAVDWVVNTAKVVGENTFHEGIVEEGGQGAIEQYYTKGRLEEQLTGKRSKTFAQTYVDFLKTPNGQTAVLLGGILGSTAHAVSSWTSNTKEREKKSIDYSIASLNEASDIFDSLHDNVYKMDEDGVPILEDGKRVLDQDKVEQLVAAKERVNNLAAEIREAEKNGDTMKATTLAARAQAAYLMPFVAEGEEGMSALKEMLENNPGTKEVVRRYNEEHGTEITEDEFVSDEVAKARKLKGSFLEFRRNNTVPITYAIQKSMDISNKDLGIADGIRELFNRKEEGNFQELEHTKNHLNDTIETLGIEADKEKADKGTTDSYTETVKDKLAAEELLKEVKKSIASLESKKDRESRWKSYYAQKTKVLDINDGKLTSYLDTLIGDIKKAATTEEVEALVKKAEEDGIILEGVKLESYKYTNEEGKVVSGFDAITEMAASDNIIIALGAFKILESVKEREHMDLVNEAVNNVNRLYAGMHEIFNAATEAFNKESARALSINEEQEKLTVKMNKVLKELELIQNEAALMESMDKRKQTKALRKTYKGLLKSRKELVNILNELDSKRESLEKELKEVTIRLESFLMTAKTITKNIPNKSVKEKLNKVLEDVKGIKTYHTSSENELSHMPYKLDNIVEALIKQKDLISEQPEQVKSWAGDVAAFDNLKGTIAYYNQLKTILTSIKNRVESSIKKIEAYTANTENTTNLITAKEELSELEKKLEEVEIKLINLEAKYEGKKDTNESNKASFLETAASIIQAITDLDGSLIKDKKAQEAAKKEAEELTEDKQKAAEEEATNTANNPKTANEIQGKLEQDIKDIEQKIKNLRKEDGSITKEDMSEFKELQRKKKEAITKAKRGNNIGNNIAIKTRPKGDENPTILVGEEAIIAENAIEDIIIEGVKNGKSVNEILEKINETYSFGADSINILYAYISDRVNDAPTVGNNKAPFPTWRRGDTISDTKSTTDSKPDEVDPLKEMGFETEVPEKPVTLNDEKVNEEINTVFKSHPELAKIGTEKEYEDYLATIFPDSKVNTIVYHGAYIEADELDVNKNPRGKFLFFTTNLSIAKDFSGGGKIFSYKVNATNPSSHNFTGRGYAGGKLKYSIQNTGSGVNYGTGKGDFAIEEFDTIEEAKARFEEFKKENGKGVTDPMEIIHLHSESKSTKGTEGTVKEDKQNGFDSTIFENITEGNRASADNIAANSVVVYNNDQLHKIGSKDDLEGFSNYINKTSAETIVDSIKFTPFEDSTEGKGMDRIPVELSLAFEVLFSKTKGSFTNLLKTYLSFLEGDKVTLEKTLIDLGIAISQHREISKPFLDKLSKENKEKLISLKDVIESEIAKYYGIETKKDAAEQATIEKTTKKEQKEAKQGSKKANDPTISNDGESVSNSDITPSTETSGVDDLVDIIDKINNSDIAAEIQDVINEKKKALKRRKVKIARDKAEQFSIRRKDAILEDGVVKEGSDAYFSFEGHSEKVNIELIIETQEDGINVLVRREDGSHVITSIMNLSKNDKSAKNANRSLESKYKEQSERRRKNGDNVHNAASIPIVKEGKLSPRRNPETRIIENIEDAFAVYNNEARDKSNDRVTFSLKLSDVNGIPKRVREQAEALRFTDPTTYANESFETTAARIPLTEEEKAIQSIPSLIARLEKGEKLSEKEMDLLANHLPISLRVFRSNQAGSAGSHLLTAKEGSKDSFNKFSKPVRIKVINTWIANGAKLSKETSPNTLGGVEAKWSHVSQGFLNTDSNANSSKENYKVTDLKGITLDNMEIFAIESSNKAFNKKGELVPTTFSTENKEGMVVLKVKTNTGKDFPLFLTPRTLEGTKELGIVMKIFEEVVDKGVTYSGEISEQLKGLLKEVPLLQEAFGAKKITYEALYKTIMISGEVGSQVRVDLFSKNKSIRIGETVYDKEGFNENRKLIENTIALKYQRTGFTNRSKNEKNVLTVDNKAYLKYLTESKVLSTNVFPDQPIFIGVQLEGSNYVSGIGVYLTPTSITNSVKAAAKTTTQLKLSMKAKLKLKNRKIDISKMTQEEIQIANDLFSKTKATMIGKDMFDTIIRDINNRSKDNEVKKCE